MLLLWSTALAVAALGTAVLYAAAPGLNWVLWTATAAAALALCAWWGGRALRALGAMLALAVGLAAGAAVTADRGLQLWTAVAVAMLLSLATRLAAEGGAVPVGLARMALAPVAAAAGALAEASRRALELLVRAGGRRSRPFVRGGAASVGVVTVFAWILAGADPILAALREDVVRALEQLDVLPRLVFFGALLVAGVGAGGAALAEPRATPVPAALPRAGGSSAVERLMILGGVAVLFGAFLALQVSYLFGNAPATVGSGVTFAEYARRGFAELTLVSSLCALLMLALARRAAPDAPGQARLLELALLLELGLLLVSALRRVGLYEAAYGYTTARLYGRVYMAGLGLALVLLAVELWRGVDVARFWRRSAAVAGLALATVCFWNHQAWIAERNLARFAGARTLDASYLVHGLSPDAVPTLVRARAAAPALDALLRARYARATAVPCAWYEWNLRRDQAARALAEAGLLAGGPATPRGCVRVQAAD